MIGCLPSMCKALGWYLPLREKLTALTITYEHKNYVLGCNSVREHFHSMCETLGHSVLQKTKILKNCTHEYHIFQYMYTLCNLVKHIYLLKHLYFFIVKALKIFFFLALWDIHYTTAISSCPAVQQCTGTPCSYLMARKISWSTSSYYSPNHPHLW